MNEENSLKEFWIKYNSFIINSLILIIILLIIFFSFYPGIMTYDGNFQWNEVQSNSITNIHPFFSTYFLFLLSKLHNTTVTAVLYQILLFSLAWGYLCQSIKCFRKQEYLKYLITLIVGLTPLISIYQITLWKDIMYTSYLFCIGIMLFNFSKRNYSSSSYAIFGILCVLVFSYRFNGIIVSLLIILMLVAIILKKYRFRRLDKNSLKNILIIFISFFVVLLMVSTLKQIVVGKTTEKIKDSDNEEVSLSSIDSYMVWMMGAHIEDNNVKDKEDLKFLNKIIPVEEWKKSYNPYLINNTTLAENFDKSYVFKNNSKFRKVFLKYTKRYPLTIVKHYIKSDGILINPISMIKGYVYVFDFSESYNPKGFYQKTNSKIPFVQKKYTALINITLKRPFIIFYQPAFILYVTVALTVILSLKIYGKRIWLFVTPMLFNTLSLLPINLAQDLRYVYINYLTFFGILLTFAINYKSIFYSKIKLKH